MVVAGRAAMAVVNYKNLNIPHSVSEGSHQQWRPWWSSTYRALADPGDEFQH